MKIKKLYMDNFKSMNDFEMSFGDYVIIAGNNSAGKTTILHALDFLHYACTSDLGKYLDERGFKSTELLSQFSSKKTIKAKVIFENNDKEIIWEVSFVSNKTGFSLSQEKVTCDGRVYLEIKSKFTSVYSEIHKENAIYNRLALNSSYIRYFTDEEDYPILLSIKKFFEQSEFLDLLSPVDMRKPNRAVSSNIGQKGAYLSGYIKQMKPENRILLAEDIKKYFSPIVSIKVVSTGRGWFRISVGEQFKKNSIEVTAGHISDGLLRLIAMFSLKYIERSNDYNGGLLVLDEIEDGINTENLEGLYNAFKELSRIGIQVVITTHSTILLDYAEPNEIYYVGRSSEGSLLAANIKNIDVLSERIEYCFPGEAILNSNDKEIKESLISYINRNSSNPDLPMEDVK